MMGLRTIAFAALILGLVPELILALDPHSPRDESLDLHSKRAFEDTLITYNRKRNAHGCIMSIVFVVLYPMGAIGIHLPIESIPYLKNSYLRKKVMAIHVPIQLIAFVMMVGGMALGIRIATDLDYFNQHPVHAHMIIGLLVTCTIIVFQPILGTLQHLHFNKTGGKSIFAYLHRWIGRVAIILGMINTGLGFQLVGKNDLIITKVPTSSYVREYVLLGFFVSLWLSLVIYDQFRHKSRQEKQVTPVGDDVPLEEPNHHVDNNNDGLNGHTPK